MLIAILITFAAAAAAPFLFKVVGRATGLLLALVPAGLTAYYASLFPRVLAGDIPQTQTPWFTSLGIDLAFRADGWSLLFTLLISGIGTLVVIYGASYLAGHKQIGRFFCFLFMFMASMLGVVTCDNLIGLFVFWELTSISSYFLIGFYHEEEKSRISALQAVLVTGAGGLCMLAGFLLLGHAAGTFQISAIIAAGGTDAQLLAGLSAAVLPLILLGAFTKSAQFPFHFWLPNAMAAPAPVSAYLHSSTMVKAGIYLLARFLPLFGQDPLWQRVLPVIGIITVLTGAVLALRENDMKRQLAYVTVASLGILVVLLGLNTPHAAEAAVVFLLAHAFYKGSLFMVAGTVDHAVHCRDSEKLGGLAPHMPFTAAAAVLAGVSMASLPPVLGFIAKEEVLGAALHGPSASWLTAGITAGAVVFVFLFLLIGIKPFFGTLETAGHKVHKPDTGLWIGSLLLALGGLAAGLFPAQTVEPLLAAASEAIHPGHHHLHLALWHGLNPALYLSLFSVAAGFGLYFLRAPIRAAFKPVTLMLDPIFVKGPEFGYQQFMAQLMNAAKTQTRWVQNGYLRQYFRMIFVTLIILAGAAIGRTALPAVPALTPGWLDVVLCLVMIAAAVSSVFMKGRLSTVANIGVVGLCITVVFVMYGAPDLAMTQFVVDILSVALLAFVMHRLPRHQKLCSKAAHVIDAVIAVAGGVLITVYMLIAASKEPGMSALSKFFTQYSVAGGHGHNIVNVILVDFRGIDTMGEITVLMISGLGAFSLLRLALTKRKRS
jgi:multicomponent Na+:H+ antiporter subunit A